MGNVMQRFKSKSQAAPQQGAGYPPALGPPGGQQPPPPMGPPPMQMQQPIRQYAPPPMQMQQPIRQYFPPPMPMQQPISQYSPPPMPMQQPISQYAPPPMQMQQPMSYGSGPSYSYGGMSSYPSAPSLLYPNDPNQSLYQNAHLSNVTGLPTEQIERLRREFFSYANTYGVIDRKGFRKLYVASLLNMTWQAIEHDAEAAFRNFDSNQTGVLDFEEYVTSCARMSGGNPSGFGYQQGQY